jgi:hypothetical protein
MEIIRDLCYKLNLRRQVVFLHLLPSRCQQHQEPRNVGKTSRGRAINISKDGDGNSRDFIQSRDANCSKNSSSSRDWGPTSATAESTAIVEETKVLRAATSPGARAIAEMLTVVETPATQHCKELCHIGNIHF